MGIHRENALGEEEKARMPRTADQGVVLATSPLELQALSPPQGMREEQEHFHKEVPRMVHTCFNCTHKSSFQGCNWLAVRQNSRQTGQRVQERFCPHHNSKPTARPKSRDARTRSTVLPRFRNVTLLKGE